MKFKILSMNGEFNDYEIGLFDNHVIILSNNAPPPHDPTAPKT